MVCPWVTRGSQQQACTRNLSSIPNAPLQHGADASWPGGSLPGSPYQLQAAPGACNEQHTQHSCQQRAAAGCLQTTPAPPPGPGGACLRCYAETTARVHGAIERGHASHHPGTISTILCRCSWLLHHRAACTQPALLPCPARWGKSYARSLC